MKRLIWMLAMVCWLGPTPALADYYVYETETGVKAFTDDLERIPARYRDRAELQQDLAIQDYERTSIVLRTPEYPSRLPVGEDEAVLQSAPAVGARDTVTIEVDEGISLDVPVTAGADGEPVVVETGIIESDGRGTAERSVVKRGDRIVLEVRKPLFNWIKP